MNNTVQKQKLSTATKSNVVAMFVSNENELVKIYFSVDSGQVVTRSKIDTVTQVYHPGIILGDDIFGQTWVVHNHYSNKRPICEPMEKYSQGQQMYWDDRPVNYGRVEIVDRAINEALAGQRYHAVNYNCQTFVNIVVADDHTSEAVDKLSNMAIGGGLALGILGWIFDSNALKVAGATVAASGVAGRIYSRIDRK